MSYFYAQINKDNICVGVSSLSGKVTADNMLRLEIYDTSLLGKKYNNGVWEEVPQPPEPEPEPTQLDRIELQVKTSYTEAQNQAVDQYTEELLEGGIL